MVRKTISEVALVSVVVGIMSGVGSAFCQEPARVVSVNPVGLVWGIANAEYQQNIDRSSAWAVRGLYWGHKTGDWSWNAIGAGGSYRRFFSPTAPKGGYWGVGVDALNFSAKYSGESGSAFFFGPKVEVGYRWLLGKNFAISLGAEFGYYIGSLEIAGESIPFSGFAFGIPVNIGFAF